MMPTVLERSDVARNDTNIRMDAGVVRKAKMVAASRGIGLAEYLSESLRPIVDRDLEAEIGRELGSAPKPRRPKGGES